MIVFGSFVTSKGDPTDVDVFLLMADGFDVSGDWGNAPAVRSPRCRGAFRGQRLLASAPGRFGGRTGGGRMLASQAGRATQGRRRDRPGGSMIANDQQTLTLLTWGYWGWGTATEDHGIGRRFQQIKTRHKVHSSHRAGCARQCGGHPLVLNGRDSTVRNDECRPRRTDRASKVRQEVRMVGAAARRHWPQFAFGGTAPAHSEVAQRRRV